MVGVMPGPVKRKRFLVWHLRQLGFERAGALLVGPLLFCAFTGMAFAQVVDGAQAPQTSRPPVALGPITGIVSGTVVDASGAVAAGARVQLRGAGEEQPLRTISGSDGQFSFANVAPGPFQLTISAPGFETKVVSGMLETGKSYIVPEVALRIAAATTNVKVGVNSPEVAQIQLHNEEKQRVLGIVPNYYVTYLRNPVPLTAGQKFQLAWKNITDPFTIVGEGALAGIQQAAGDYPGFGQGVAGYAKRFGADYATHVTGTLLDRALLPSLFKQDPRYFYQGSGSTGSRILHALSYAVVLRGDNGCLQPNYSGFIGSFAAAGISYSYYPAGDRSTGLLLQNALVGIAGKGVGGLFQEFVLRRFTSHSGSHPSQP